LKIIVISPNKALKEQIRQHLQEVNTPREILLFDNGSDKLAQITEQEHPDILIMEGLDHGLDQLKFLEQFSLHYPATELIIFNENASSEFLMKAMRSGVSDVLHLPLVAEDLQLAVRRVESKLKQASGRKKIGKVIAFIGSKGGSGATFLACNLAYVLAAQENEKVALLDLNLQFGDAALFVSDQVPANTLADVSANISRLDATLLASSMVQVLPNFGLLAAPEDAEHAAEVKPAHIDVLMKLAKNKYDYVVLDIGRTLNASTIKALDHADMIFVVLQESLPFIRDSKRLIVALQSLGYDKNKIYLMLNRHEKRGDISVGDIEAALDMKVFKSIPNSYVAVSASVNQGVPIMKIAKHDAVTHALQDIAQTLLESTHAVKKSWLDNLLHRA
jgi:pilus assembly protein CpaE